jgi:hypothetical protein
MTDNGKIEFTSNINHALTMVKAVAKKYLDKKELEGCKIGKLKHGVHLIYKE